MRLEGKQLKERRGEEKRNPKRRESRPSLCIFPYSHIMTD